MRYFFDLMEHGNSTADMDGVDCLDAERAERFALKLLAEIANGEAVVSSPFKVSVQVRDERELVYEANLVIEGRRPIH